MLFWKKFLIHLASNSLSFVVPAVLIVTLAIKTYYWPLFAIPFLVQGLLSFLWVWKCDTEVQLERIKKQAKPLLAKDWILRMKTLRLLEAFQNSIPEQFRDHGHHTPKYQGLEMSQGAKKNLAEYTAAKKELSKVQEELKELAIRWRTLYGQADGLVGRTLLEISSDAPERKLAQGFPDYTN